MSSNVLTASPVWTAAGWTMLHVIWVGAAIGVIAAFVRGLFRSAQPERGTAPLWCSCCRWPCRRSLVFVWVFEPDSAPRIVRRSVQSRA